MKHLDRSERPFPDRLRLRLGRALVCSVCDRLFPRTRTWDDHMASPLAGYIVLDTCPACVQHRAVYPGQAAWFAARFLSDSPSTPPSAASWAWLEEAVTIDGGSEDGHEWPAVHVHEDGLYVPLREWIGSGHHVSAHAAHEERLRSRAAA